MDIGLAHLQQDSFLIVGSTFVDPRYVMLWRVVETCAARCVRPMEVVHIQELNS